MNKTASGKPGAVHNALKRLLNHRSSADVTGGYIIINVDRLRGPVDLISERILKLKEPKD